MESHTTGASVESERGVDAAAPVMFSNAVASASSPPWAPGSFCLRHRIVAPRFETVQLGCDVDDRRPAWRNGDGAVSDRNCPSLSPLVHVRTPAAGSSRPTPA